MYSFNKRNFLNFIITLMVVVFTATPVLAKENIISSVTIAKSQDKANAYELSIDSTEQVKYKRNVDEDGNIYFELKNSILADNMGTIYDDVSDIDNVVVKELDKNKVRIYIKGRYAKNTDLVFINALFETTPKAKKEIVVNRPINTYEPLNTEIDLENEEEIQDWNDNSFNFTHLLGEFLTTLKKGPMGIILIILSLISILAISIKTLASKISQDREPLIGLNSSNILNNKSENNDLESISSKSEALQKAQKELSKAHQKYQTYVQNKYKTKPKSVNVDTIKQGIALNQYQRSTQNPYKNQKVLKMQNSYSSNVGENKYYIPPRAKRVQPNNFTSPYIKRPANTVDYVPENKQSSMKFLESVTKIYERSGRNDLAEGLKNSISKAKQTI